MKLYNKVASDVEALARGVVEQVGKGLWPHCGRAVVGRPRRPVGEVFVGALFGPQYRGHAATGAVSRALVEDEAENCAPVARQRSRHLALKARCRLRRPLPCAVLVERCNRSRCRAREAEVSAHHEPVVMGEGRGDSAVLVDGVDEEGLARGAAVADGILLYGLGGAGVRGVGKGGVELPAALLVGKGADVTSASPVYGSPLARAPEVGPSAVAHRHQFTL
mmetsp:Transcript_4268/g.15029  ORF Transcript_4268/g.15029 Transcript_4268/m.15029 type:complete len:221 (+) Transcript_4268:935-1597(+)